MQNQSDQQYRVFLQPDETAKQFLARSFIRPVRTGVPLIDNHIMFKPGHILEISGPASSGKSQLLLSTMATFIMPDFYQGTHYKGQKAHVLWLDLDGKFDPLRVADIIHARCMASLSTINTATATATQQHQTNLIQSIIKDSMSRLHIITCTSSFDLLLVLHNLQSDWPLIRKPSGNNVSTTTTTTTAPPPPPPSSSTLISKFPLSEEIFIGALFIDNIASHHYIDRAVKPGGGATIASSSSSSPLTTMKIHTTMAGLVKKLMHREKVPVIVSRNDVLLSSGCTVLVRGGGGGGRQQQQQQQQMYNSPERWMSRDTMLKPWQDIVTHRLYLRCHNTVLNGDNDTSDVAFMVNRQAKWAHSDQVLTYQIHQHGITY